MNLLTPMSYVSHTLGNWQGGKKAGFGDGGSGTEGQS